MKNLLRATLALLLCLVSALLSAPSASAAPTSVGGLTVGWLPAGLGQASDFEYDYDDVRFASRDWETGNDTDGWRVDLHITVMRGESLTSPGTFHDWFVGYQDRPADEARYLPILLKGHRAWLGRDQVFWLVRPGLAVSVTVDPQRYSTATVWRIARSIRQR